MTTDEADDTLYCKSHAEHLRVKSLFYERRVLESRTTRDRERFAEASALFHRAEIDLKRVQALLGGVIG